MKKLKGKKKSLQKGEGEIVIEQLSDVRKLVRFIVESKEFKNS